MGFIDSLIRGCRGRVNVLPAALPKDFLSKEELLFEIPKENGASAGGARYAADCGAADLASFLYGLLKLSETGLPQLRRFCRLEKLF